MSELLTIVSHENPDEQVAMDFWEAAGHPYECDCDLCKEYWRLINEAMAEKKNAASN